MEKRILGLTGAELSVIGLGGVVIMNEEPDTVADWVTKAIGRGINYFDVAPSYGNAQELLGPALEPYRKDIFLACKTAERTAAGARKQLEHSLKELRTPQLDLYQLHGITSREEVDTITGTGGALETFIKGKEEGLIRFLGFSAHTEEAALVMMDRFDFDSVMFPVNWVSWYQGGFGPRVLDEAGRKGVGILALKSLARRRWEEGEDHKGFKSWYRPVNPGRELELSLRFTLSCPVTAAVCPGGADLLWQACEVADTFVPLKADEERELVGMSNGLIPIFPKKDTHYR